MSAINQGKIMIASDIHGSAHWCEKLVRAFEKEKPQKLLLLGDLLYHGPRNPLPDEYSPKRVAELLNSLKTHILCVRGNCDAEVDQMLLEFPVLADYAVLLAGEKTLFATHGHLFGPENPPALSPGELLLNGHFHVPCHKQLPGGILYVNCGSVALPKDGTPHSYALFDGGELLWKDLDGNIFDRLAL